MANPETVETAVSVVVDREKYQACRTASGTKSLNNGDEVATVLAGLSIDAIHSIGTGCLDVDTAEKYGHLNVGMQRMNVGNRLRGWVNGKQKVAEGEAELDRFAFVVALAEPFVEQAKEAAAATAAKAEKVAEEKAAAAVAKAEKAAKAKKDKAA